MPDQMRDATMADPSQAPTRVTSAPVEHPLVGQRLAGKYLIEEPLGSGGMSVVYRGRNEAIDRVVAIKTIKFAMSSEPVIMARFEREIKSMSRLNHINIVTVYDCVLSPDGQPYIIMDFIPGASLDKVLNDEGALDQTRAVKIFIQVCAALEHAHRHGIVHRDLKPANIMISKDSNGNDFIKVVDFGLAKMMEETQRLTSTGQIWGSIPYMSPEQCSTGANVETDQRTDIYSLGITMFETLTGRKPFISENIMEVVAAQLYEEAPSFKEKNPHVSVLPNLEAVVQSALNKNPDARYQSMREFREAIEFAAAPLLQVDQAKHDQILHERQSAHLKRSTTKPGVKKTPTMQDFLKKKKQQSPWKIPLIIAGTSIGTAVILSLAAYFLVMSFRPKTTTVTRVIAPAMTAPRTSVPATTAPATMAPIPTATQTTSLETKTKHSEEPALQEPAHPASFSHETGAAKPEHHRPLEHRPELKHLVVKHAVAKEKEKSAPSPEHHASVDPFAKLKGERTNAGQ